MIKFQEPFNSIRLICFKLILKFKWWLKNYDKCYYDSDTKLCLENENDYVENIMKTLNSNRKRYVTKLPFIENVPDTNHIILAKKGSENLVFKLCKNLGQLWEFDNILNDCLQEGILEEISPISKIDTVHYLPHWAVIKEDRETTKTQIVFDVSAKYRHKKSLNSMHSPGPCLLSHIFGILVWFQLQKIEIVADITKAFLQIAIDKDQRNFLWIIWYEKVFAQNPTVKILRFARVFGLTSCSFILNRMVRINLARYLRDKQIKEIILKLIKDFYVDNVTSSFHNQIEG